MNEVRKFKFSNVIVHLLLIILVVINLFPLYWMLTFSLKTNDEILGHSYVDEVTGERVRVEPNRVGLPKQWEWSNYSEAMNTGNMGQYFLNSLVVAVLVILITLVASFMATYALTDSRGHRTGIRDSFPDETPEHLCSSDFPLCGLRAVHGNPDQHRVHGRYPV